MRVRVHRGCDEVGGTCVEVESQGRRIVLDVGRPLSAGRDDEVALPDVHGMATGDDPTLLGVLISHPHLDHYGLVDQVAPSVPVYVGGAAAATVEAARFFAPASPALRVTAPLQHDVPLRLGPFTVTPRLVDHSAFDSYVLLVEGEGERLLYTGDIRGHGRKASTFQRLVSHPPAGVDTLLMEGTHVPVGVDDHESRRPLHEWEVERDMTAAFARASGLVQVVSSSQNIDRLVTVYKAARRAGRVLVVDLCTAAVAAATGRRTIPQPGFPDLGVYVTGRQRLRVKESGEFQRVEALRAHRVHSDRIAADPDRYVVLAPASATSELIRYAGLRGGLLVWSLWSGYLKEPSGARLLSLLDREAVAMEQHHTSGHASVADLQRLVAAVAPRQLVPVHTEGADEFGRYFPAVVRQRDGDWWPVARRPLGAIT